MVCSLLLEQINVIMWYDDRCSLNVDWHLFGKHFVGMSGDRDETLRGWMGKGVILSPCSCLLWNRAQQLNPCHWYRVCESFSFSYIQNITQCGYRPFCCMARSGFDGGKCRRLWAEVHSGTRPNYRSRRRRSRQLSCDHVTLPEWSCSDSVEDTCTRTDSHDVTK